MLPIPLGCFALAILYSFFSTYGPPDEIVLGGRPFLQLIRGENGRSRLKRTPLISDQAYNPMDDIVVEESNISQSVTTSLLAIDVRASRTSSSGLERLCHSGLSQDGYLSVLTFIKCKKSRLELLVAELLLQAQEVGDTLLDSPVAGLAFLCAIMALICVLRLSVVHIDNSLPQGSFSRKASHRGVPKTPNKRRCSVSSESVAMPLPVRVCGDIQPYFTSTPTGATDYIEHPIYRFRRVADDPESTTSFSFCLGQGVSFPGVDITSIVPIAEISTTTLSPLLATVLSHNDITSSVSQTFNGDTQSDQSTFIDATELVQESKLNEYKQESPEKEELVDEVSFELFGNLPNSFGDSSIKPFIPQNEMHTVVTEADERSCLLSPGDSNPSSPNPDYDASQKLPDTSPTTSTEKEIGASSDSVDLEKSLLVVSTTHNLDANISSVNTPMQNHSKEPNYVSQNKAGDVFVTLPMTTSINNETEDPSNRPMPKRPRVNISTAVASCNKVVSSGTPVFKNSRLVTDTQEGPIRPRLTPRSVSGLSLNLDNIPILRPPMRRPPRRNNAILGAEELEEDAKRTVRGYVREIAVQPSCHQLINLVVEEDLLSGYSSHRCLRRVRTRPAREARMEGEAWGNSSS